MAKKREKHFYASAVVKGEEKAYGAFGSVYYIAPEALEPKEYDEKVDVWATGIVALVLPNFTKPKFWIPGFDIAVLVMAK